MYGLTGIATEEWAVVCVTAVATYLLGAAFLASHPRFRLDRRGVFLLVAAVVLLAIVLIRFTDWLVDPRRIVTRPAAILVGGAIALVVIALGDLMLGRVVRLIEWPLTRLHVSDRIAGTTALTTSLLIILASSVGALEAMKADEASVTGIHFDGGAALVASYPVPGNVTDIAFVGDLDGYLSLAEGRILHFRLPDPPSGDLEITTAATGLHDPRGLAILEDRLFVTELGPLPCPATSQFCDGSVVGPSPEEGELEILRSSRGRVLAFEIGPDAGLSGKRVLLDDLPVATSWHGVSGLTAGPDGYLYVTIAGIDLTWQIPDAVRQLSRPNLDLLGTVVRISPDGRDVEVFARGLRNVYGIDFDEDGSLYGEDNSGPTIGGWRSEELLHIQKGANYGYPLEGTFGSHTVRTDGPLWTMATSGSAGIAWRGRFGLSPGLLVGSCSRLESVRLATDSEGSPQVTSVADVTVLMDQVEGCITAIEPGPESLALVSAFSWCIWCTGPTADTFPLLLIDVGDVS